MNAVGSVAIAVSGAGNQQAGCCQRENPAQQAMQQIVQYLQGMMMGQMLGQALNGQNGHNGQQGCLCSQRQNPNFGGLNGLNGIQNGFGPAPGLATPGFGAPSLTTPGFALPQSNGLLAGMPSLGLTGLNGGNANSLYNGLPNGLAGVPNPYETGPITPLAQGLPSLAFTTLGQNPNPGFAGGNNITGLIPPVFVPQLQNSLGSTIIPAGNGLPVAFGNNLGSFLG